MMTALVLILTACLVQGALSREFVSSLPKKIEALEGSCVTIPCSFDIREIHDYNLDNTCKALWLNDAGTVRFDSGAADDDKRYIPGQLNGDLLSKNCTTTLNDMKPEYSDEYFFRLQCRVLKFSFDPPRVQISVKGTPQRPNLTPSTLEVREGTSVSLTCSAPAPCLSLPPTLTWTPGLGESQETLKENQDKTQFKTSVVNFNASHLHNKREISCTAVYRKEGGSTESSVNISLTADITYTPKDTLVSVIPSGPVQENTNVTLTCSSNANPAVRNYTWYRADDGGGQEALIETGQTLRFKASKCSVPVFCQAENELGVGRSNYTQIDVQYSPRDTTVTVSPPGPVKEDTNVTLTCSSKANPAVRNYTWYRNDDGGGQGVLIETGHVLTIKASRKSPSFYCMAENVHGTEQSNSSQFDVQYPPQILPSSICTKTVDQLNCSCEISGNPAPTLHWYMDGTVANDSDGFAVRYEPKKDTGIGFIAVSQAQWKNQFTLLCNSSNSLGSAAQRFYFLLEPQISTDSQTIVPILIAIVVALIVLVCALLIVIRTQKFHQNLLKSQCSGNGSTIATSQLLPQEKGKEVLKSKEEDIYVNAIELKEADVTKPTAPSEPKSPGMASSGLNSTEGARNISEEANNESKEIVYSSVTWRSKNKQKEEGDNTNQKDGTEGRLSRDFINKAAEMGALNEVEPPNVKGKTECEYAQVKYKDKNVVID